jgi:uncharacterized protein
MIHSFALLAFGVIAAAGMVFSLSRAANRPTKVLSKGSLSGKCGQPVVHAIRIVSGGDVKSTISDYVSTHHIEAGAVISCVGSTSQCVIRLADAKAGTDGSFLEVKAPAEILSLSGTVAIKGSHLHIALGDDKGKVVGGHLVSAIVNTTCEVLICDLSEDLEFDRQFDSNTGYKELMVISKS